MEIRLWNLFVRDGATFDVIIVDFRMPGMNGIDVSRIILKHRPKQRFVLVTANDYVQEEALSLGMYFLQKPFSLKTLEKGHETSGDRS